MTPTRAAAYVALASVLVAWLAGAAGLTAPPSPRQEPPQRPVAPAVQALAAEVQAQANRLRDRLAAAPAPRPFTRNPFDFAPRPSARRTPPGADDRVVAPPVVEPNGEPPLQLIGVAEQEVSGVRVRTAVITADSDEPFMVVAGDTLGARYRVASVSADGVELMDLVTGATRRLALR